MHIAELSLEDAAQALAGNWRTFTCFVWDRERELVDPENWSVIYTHHRDSGLLDLSNAAAIRQELLPFTAGDDPDVVFESHSHWAVGHIDGFSLRVFRDGQVTRAFQKYHELKEQLSDYPILDEEDYSNREYEATLSNIENAAWRLKSQFALSEGWTEEIYSWLSDHDCGEIENTDDQGGSPSESALKRAFQALRYQAI